MRREIEDCFNSDEGHTWLMHLCISYGPWWVHSALFRARSVPTHLSTNLVSPARPNELRSRKTFGVCRTRMPPCVCIDGPFHPHFARARAKGKRSFRTDRQRPAFFRPFGRSISNLQRICLIYRLIWLTFGPIFDRWLRTPCPVQCNIRKWNTAALTRTMAKHVQKPPVTMAKYVQKPPVTMAKYVRKPTDREGNYSFAVDIVRLTDEKRRCPVPSTTLNRQCVCLY